MRYRNKGLVKKILLALMCVVTVGGAVGVAVALTNPDKLDSKSISGFSYGVGGLDSTGKYKNTDTSIYTEKAFECQGLAITLDFEAEIQYRVFFYDQDNELVHATAKLSRTFTKTEVPFFAKTARIEITPTDDVKVSKLEVLKYAKQLNATVYREQGFKNYTADLMEVDVEGYLIGQADGVLVASEVEGAFTSKFINIVDYKETLLFRATSTDLSTSAIYCYTADKTYSGVINVGDVATVVFTTSEGVNYYSIPMTALTKSTFASATNYIRFSISVPFEVHCR